MTRNASLSLSARLGDWKFGTAPMYRSFRLNTRPIVGERREVEFDGTGWKASLDYRPGDHWYARVEGASYRYSNDPRRLNNSLAQLLFTSRALTLTSGLLDRYASGEIGFDTDRAGLSVYRTHTVSALDMSDVHYTGLVVSLYLSESLTVELDAGKSDPEPGEDGSYGYLALGWHW